MGCTPGFWRNHSTFAPGNQDDEWVGLTAGQDFDTVFGVNWFNPNRTLQVAITTPGDAQGVVLLGTLGFHVVAAQLNINSPDVDPFGLTQAQLDTIIGNVSVPPDDATVATALALIKAANEAEGSCPNS
ncbi:hypothetical protein LCGC14_3141660 [marine sediment metagenome]|uniref:Uncharacterized protein n=1 Tax=marine sediment metagenome TaxID=412755 RepID=A0A0F8VWK9_9ZZZZ